MGECQKIKYLSTNKKDEAAFYLSELARGLLRNRIRICLGERTLVMTSFDWIHLEIQALEKEDGTAVDIHLSWRKAPPGIAAGSRLGTHRNGNTP
jgi:amphi-Trp domain-containing protein